jgi:hypothetical protein
MSGLVLALLLPLAAIALTLAAARHSEDCKLCHYQGQPADSSVTCIGCHDGTAASAVDLATSHPVMVPGRDGMPNLDAAGRVQCASCHEPHDPALQRATCIGCHDK